MFDDLYISRVHLSKRLTLSCNSFQYNPVMLLKSQTNFIKSGSHLHLVNPESLILKTQLFAKRSPIEASGKDYNIKLILLLTSRTSSKDQNWIFLLQLYAKSQSLLSFVEVFSVGCDWIVLRMKRH